MTRIVAEPPSRGSPAVPAQDVSGRHLQDAWRREMERAQIAGWTVREIPAPHAEHAAPPHELRASAPLASTSGERAAQPEPHRTKPVGDGAPAATTLSGVGVTVRDTNPVQVSALLPAKAPFIRFDEPALSAADVTLAAYSAVPPATVTSPPRPAGAAVASASTPVVPQPMVMAKPCAGPIPAAAATSESSGAEEPAHPTDWPDAGRAEPLQKQRMHLVTDGQDVDVWIRDSTLNAARAASVAYRLIGTLAESGLRLRAVTVNGSNAYRAAGRVGNRISGCNDAMRSAASTAVMAGVRTTDNPMDFPNTSGGSQT